MGTFCTSCGTLLPNDARFCGACGAAIVSTTVSPQVDPAQAPVSPASFPAEPGYADPPTPKPEQLYTAPETDYQASDPSVPKSNNLLLIGGGFSLLALLGLLYFYLFRYHNMANEGGTPTAEVAPKIAETAKQFYTVTQANIRDRATAVDSVITGKLPRGTAVSGKLALGEDGVSDWLALADGKGFVAAVNLSENAPPVLSKLISDKIWAADKPIEIWALPDSASSLIDRIAIGTNLTIAGLTGNDYLEIKLRKGGVGYIAEGARILALLDAKPITMNFNPNSCSFGGEVQPLFEKLAASAKAEYDAIDNNTALSDAAREKALSAIEGKSHYLKLQRSFNGLTISGIAQHYESQSVYFSDPAAKVIEVFRGLGFKIGKDGIFPSQDLYAGISATSGKSGVFGKSDLGCGV